jgi:hypothetical protein
MFGSFAPRARGSAKASNVGPTYGKAYSAKQEYTALATNTTLNLLNITDGPGALRACR